MVGGGYWDGVVVLVLPGSRKDNHGENDHTSEKHVIISLQLCFIPFINGQVEGKLLYYDTFHLEFPLAIFSTLLL